MNEKFQIRSYIERGMRDYERQKTQQEMGNNKEKEVAGWLEGERRDSIVLPLRCE